MELKYTNEDIKTMIKWPLDKKVKVAQLRILEWCRYYDNKVCVAFSGGKNSIVLLDLVRRVLPCCQAVHINNGIHFEIEKFVEDAVENVLMVELESGSSIECLRKANSDKIVKWSKDYNKHIFIGNTIEGSRKRKRLWQELGCNAFEEGTSQPLSYWTKQDILHYLFMFNINYPKAAFGNIVQNNGKFKFIKYGE